MKALLSVSPGGPDALILSEVPDPRPGPGEILVRVLACAINYPDVLIIEDKYQVKPPRPFAPGTEISGVVEALGDEVTGWTVGDELISIVGYGGLTEKLVIPAGSALPVPGGKDPREAAGLLLTYATTIYALLDRGELKQGETLLVLGAAGGVGLAAIEIGKILGATVVAAVSSEEKAAIATEAGADRVVVYGSGPFDDAGCRALAKQLKEAVGPDGAHVTYDPVGGDYTEAALRAIAWNGRHLVVGFAASIPKPPLNLTLLKGCDIRGVYWGAFAEREPDRHAAHVRQLITWWEDGRITPRIDRIYPLTEGGNAIAHLASRSAIGKVVVEVSRR
ncbi:NADPH:quinone oxidoreductase family protein [Sphingobium sp. DEHP117]|uniref:NADPH:quinone oxidoreductase family protein n=1 Tax=Sphingobium sp. DEHP117 TaxID=2993436 RepID=UPI0027D4ECDF|nr:zinc-binding dehydrogenase [Sphingobium sp. DEHP117]MDQ4420977.1 NADPH:quinone oxidoreductase family protein [Sphingobium sp. DEHP117]